MQIAICDDEHKELKAIRKALDTYREAHTEYSFEIDEYSTAFGILHALERGKAYDIALLDICMPGILGTDVAEAMLAKSPDMGVIFLSSSSEYAVEAFALNATHYLLKPFSQAQFDEAVDRAVKKTEERVCLSLACVDGMHRVCISEIAYVESQSHYLDIHLSSGGVLRVRMKLSEMFGKIQECPEFFKVGASYIVNFNFVRSVSENTIEMLSGVTIPVPRRSVDKVQKKYMDFCRKEAAI